MKEGSSDKKMSNRRRTSRLTAILVINIGLIVAAFLAIDQYIEKSIDEEVVYTYTRSIPPDTQISESDLKAIKVSRKAITDHVVTNPAEVVGKFTGAKIYEGELVDKRKVVEEGQINPLTELPEEDANKMRKISISIDLLSTWGGSLGKGDRVDLIFTGKTKGDSMEDVTYSKIFMQNVLVYDVLSSSGSSYIKPEDRPPIVIDDTNPESAEAAQAELERRSDVQMAILAVTPKQYEEIRLRMELGKVELVGRFEDSTNVKTKGYVSEKVKGQVTLGEYDVEEKEAEIMESPKSTGSGW